MRIVVLGAGFGGLELTTRLSEDFGDDADVVLIDRTDGFVFGFSKLEVMFGRARPSDVHHAYRDVVKPGVRFVQATIESIDPVNKRVETDAGTFDADVLVIALGADLDPSATPGLVEGGHECPPAPSETVLLLHDLLTDRGCREQSEIALVMPLGVPIPPSPAASQALLSAFAERGISWHPGQLVRRLDPDRKQAVLGDGTEMPYDLFLGVPVHRAPAVVAASGLTVDGWIPVNPLTLETSFPDVYAVGDVTSVGTPKAGVFAEGQAAVVAQRLTARVRGDAESAGYDGRGQCYLEFGRGLVGKVDVTFLSGQMPAGDLEGPSDALAADKLHFGTSRVKRWFGRDWSGAATPAG